MLEKHAEFRWTASALLDFDEYGNRWRAGLTKSSALRGGHRDVNADERVVVGQDLVAAGVPQTLRVAYPDLFAVHDPAGQPRFGRGCDDPCW